MPQMTPTGELRQTLQKSVHLSSKKITKKAFSQNKSFVLEKLYPGDVISYYYYFRPDAEKDVKYAIAIDLSKGKKKWLRKYKILTEHSLETKPHGFRKNYRIEKVK